MEPSQRDYRKGVKPDKGHGEFILVRPLAVKVKAYDPVVVELMGSRWSGSESALPRSRVVVSCPWTAAGSSLYIHRLTPGGLQNPDAGSYTCPARFLPFPNLQHKLHITWRFMSTGSNPPLGLGPLDLNHKVPYSLSSGASMWMTPYEYNPALPGRFILNSYIPNIAN